MSRKREKRKTNLAHHCPSMTPRIAIKHHLAIASMRSTTQVPAISPAVLPLPRCPAEITVIPMANWTYMIYVTRDSLVYAHNHAITVSANSDVRKVR